MEHRSEFERLADAARNEVPVPVDVTQRVLARIAAASRDSGSRAPMSPGAWPGTTARLAELAADEARLQRRPLLICAAAAVLAASVTTVFAAHWWIALDDPLASMLRNLELLNP